MADNEEKIYVLNGYQFDSKKDYDDAVNEKKGIKYLEKSVNLNDTGKVLQLYNTLLEKNMFRTPIGLEYMRKLRAALVRAKAADGMIPYVRVPSSVPENDGEDGDGGEKALAAPNSAKVRSLEGEIKGLEKKCGRYKDGRRNSIILNIILILLIIAMFVISSRSSTPNIINYERVIQDKYSSWKQQLTDKEKELKLWEKELEQKEEELMHKEAEEGR